MPLIVPTFRESNVLKLRESLCKKILMGLSPPSGIFFSASTSTGQIAGYPAWSWGSPASIFGANANPGAVYSGMLSEIFSAYAELSSTMLANVQFFPAFAWNESIRDNNPGNLLAGAFTNTQALVLSSASGYDDNGNTVAGMSYWFLGATQFPLIQYELSDPVSYFYTVGESLAGTENQLYGSNTRYYGFVCNVGSAFYQITQYELIPTGGVNGTIGSPIATIVPRTQGTTPVNVGGWTVANGNGAVLVPMPNYSDSIVTIETGWPSAENTPVHGYPAGLACTPISPAPFGLANVLTILPN
jgi:hypothetical protein